MINEKAIWESNSCMDNDGAVAKRCFIQYWIYKATP